MTLTLIEMGNKANEVADQFAPAMLAGAGVTLMVIVCNEDGWGLALRGSRPHAITALEAAIQDVRAGDGYKPFDPVVA